MLPLVCATTLLLCQSTSSAPLVHDGAVHLDAGASAPFSGQLLDTETAIELGLRASQCQERTDAAVYRAERDGAYKLRVEQMLRGLDADAAKDRETKLRRELDAARVWWRDPLVVAPATVILTVLTVILARETVIER